EAATKLIWLGLRNITANWGHAAHDWKVAMNQFAILYGDRFTSPNTKKLIIPSASSSGFTSVGRRVPVSSIGRRGIRQMSLEVSGKAR
ncbi:hypothetical protein NLO86_20230, partial [Pseudomonas savastanoi]|nr:hypothetical protein [Pseudomonas savastanoi]